MDDAPMPGAHQEESIFGGSTSARTRAGELVELVVERAQLLVTVREGTDEVMRASIPYPDAGYGGHELLLSPGERYLAMWLYSGQSEVGYELFTLRPSLERVHRLPYVQGVGYGPAFAPDERRIALAWATNSRLSLDEHESDDEGRALAECVVEWGRVHVRELPGGAVRECTICVRLPAGFPIEGDESYYPERLALTADAVLFGAPWGTPVRIPFPLPETITIDGPASR